MHPNKALSGSTSLVILVLCFKSPHRFQFALCKTTRALVINEEHLYAQDYAQNGYLILGYQNNIVGYAPNYMVIFV